MSLILTATDAHLNILQVFYECNCISNKVWHYLQIRQDSYDSSQPHRTIYHQIYDDSFATDVSEEKQ